MRAAAGLVLLVVAMGLIQPVLAGEIEFSAASPQVFDVRDEEIAVSVDVKNTVGEDVFGSFSWTVRDPNDSSKTQSVTDSRAMFADAASTEFRLRPGGGECYLVDVAFDYQDDTDPDTVYHVALDGIELLFSDDPEGAANNASTTVLESVQTKITKGGARTSSGAVGGTSSSAGTPVQVAAMPGGPDDTGSLSLILDQDALDLQEEKTRLKGCVTASALYASVDEVLEGAGFSPGDLGVTLGRGIYNDEFETRYVGVNHTEISVSGEASGGKVLFVVVNATGTVPPVYGIKDNATYLSLDAELQSGGYTVRNTVMNVTPGAAAVRIVYDNGGGSRVVNITVRDGAPVSVVLEDPNPGVHYVFPLLLLAVSVAAALLCYRIYVRWSRRSELPGEPGGDAGPEPAASPADLLGEGYDAYLEGALKDAFGKMGQALRLSISQNHGGGKNATNRRALSLLASVHDPDCETYAAILSVCDAAVYGGRTPDAEAFAECYRWARELLDRSMRE
ncbi:MAG: hypothetical protein PWP08_682 [Methanofollis sp.]|nr:hypothetical protein [Methanofollis sp.]